MKSLDMSDGVDDITVLRLFSDLGAWDGYTYVSLRVARAHRELVYEYVSAVNFLVWRELGCMTQSRKKPLW